MKRPFKRARGATLFAIGAVIACATVASALHRDTPLVLQITPSPSQEIGRPVFAFNSTVLLFHSDGDHLGNGNTTPQIFLFDLTPRAKHDELGMFQLTFADQGSFNPTAAKRGRIIAFESDADHLGNGSIGRQIFAANRVRWRRGIVPLFQITRGAAAGRNPVLAGTGKYLFFTSDVDLNEQGLAPGPHVYRSEMRRLLKSGCTAYPCPLGVNPGLTLTSPETITNYSPDRRGDRLVFDSRGDAAGNGCANGASQIFVHDFRTNTTEQLTFGGADSRDPVFSRDGLNIFFESTADLKSNGNSRFNIFRIDLGVKPYPLTQLTFGTDGDSIRSEPNGRRGNRVFFQSDANLTGAPAGINRVYLSDSEQGLIRLTNSQSVQSRQAAQFLFTAFVSSADFTGNGNTAPQMFLVNAFPLIDLPVPTPLPTPQPTVTPLPGDPMNIGLALLEDAAGNNGDNTLTTVITATVSDFYSNPVPDGTWVNFRILDPTNGAVVSNGRTNMAATCNLANFEAETGITVTNQPGTAHVCLTYPGAQASTARVIEACAGGSDERLCVGGDNDGEPCLADAQCPSLGTCVLIDPPVCEQGVFTLPLPVDHCSANGQPCTDANPCTLNDVCAGGTPGQACSGGSNNGGACASDLDCPDLRQCLNGPSHGALCAGPIDCPDGTCVLTSVGSCEAANPPTCQPGTPVTCPDDGNACTQDTCNFFTGQCHTPTVCADDDNPCTDDVCDQTTGLCGIPNTGPCDDGDLCTLLDMCSGGVCVPGAPLVCTDDVNPCTDDICNPATGTCGVPIDCVCP